MPDDLTDELTLRPDLAQPGTEIHRISNESGLKGNIGQGFIGRIDCNAPDYEGGIYQDFNTEYLALSMITQGGSSGSLAVNREGYAVGLTCGSNNLDCFMIRLDLCKRALEKVQDGKDISRGTLQAKWHLQSLNDCRDLGLSQEWLDRYERAEVKYLVCAQVVLADGPIADRVEVGDILLEIDGHLVKSLLQVEMYMDDHVSEKVVLTCWGAKGQFRVESKIDDLHTLSATEMLMAHGSAFHELTFPTAIFYNLPVRGVITCAGTQEPFHSATLLESVDGIPIENITQLKLLMDDIWSRQDKFSVRILQKRLSNLGETEPILGSLLKATDKVFCELTRVPLQGGPWVVNFMSLPKSMPPFSGGAARQQLGLPQSVGCKKELIGRFNNFSSTRLAPDIPDSVAKIFSTFTPLDSHRSIFTGGNSTSRRAFGVVFDVEKGLAFTFKDDLDPLNEIFMKLGGQTLPARVTYVHPAHNVAVVQFDTASIDAVHLRACQLAPPGTLLQQGDIVYYVPFSFPSKMVKITTVMSFNESYCNDKNAQGYFLFHHLTLQLKDMPPHGQQRGLLLNEGGEILAVVDFRSEGYFLPANELRAVLEPVSQDQVGKLRFRDFDVGMCILPFAYELGLPQEQWENWFPEGYLLRVTEVPFNLPLPNKGRHPLRHGDLLLKIENKPVANISDLGMQYNQSSLHILVFRDGKEVDVEVPLLTAGDLIVDEVIHFCGSVVQKPGIAARMKSRQVYSEVYIAAQSPGSPSDMHDLPAKAFITKVNGDPVQTVDEFLALVQDVPYGKDLRLQTRQVEDDHEQTVVIRKSIFFPTMRIRRTQQGGIENLTCDSDAWDDSLQKHARIAEGVLTEGLTY